jgi:ABC-type transport system substrate-binding protein
MAASNFVEPFFTCSANHEGGINVSQFCSPRLDALVLQARASRDAADAAEAWARIDRLLVDEAPAVPLYALREADRLETRGELRLQPRVRRLARSVVGAVVKMRLPSSSVGIQAGNP